MSVLNMLQQDITDKLIVANELYAMLCDLEWSYISDSGSLLCPVCRGSADYGHKDDCDLDSVLTKADEEGYN